MQFKFDIKNILYLKMLYKDSNDKPSTTKAAIKSVSESEIVACAKFEDGVFAYTPQDVTLSIICSDGLYRTQTLLKSIKNEDPYTYLYLEVPNGFEYQQNREYFRICVNFDCTYTYKKDEQEYKIQTQTCNISANGVTIILPKFEVPDEDAELSVSVYGIDLLIGVRYVRTEVFEDCYKVSFTYSEITESDRDLIAQACIKQQLELRRKRAD